MKSTKTYIVEMSSLIEFAKRVAHTKRQCDLFLRMKSISTSILTTYKPSIVFRGSWGSIENWLEPKTKPPLGNLACSNL